MILTSPDTLLQSGLIRQIGQLRTRLDQSSIEMVTGRRTDILEAVRGDNDVLLRAQAVIDTAQPAQARLAVVEGRYRVAGSALETIRDLTGEVSRAAQSAGDLASGVDANKFAATEARTALASAFSTLEARFGGRSLFGGDLGSGRVLEDVTVLLGEIQTATAGLTTAASIEAAIDTIFAPGGAFETVVYSGGAPLADPELENGLTLTTLPTADSETLRQLFKGLSMVAFNDQVDPDERAQFLRDGAEIIETAREATIADEASIGLALNAIQAEMDRQDDLLFDAEVTLENLIGRDPFDAATETQALEARLQAAYTVTSRLSSLRLTNFLR
ncbi:MAG: hypothetical protein AAGH41_00360 [Pseudomonadota bacterium]